MDWYICLFAARWVGLDVSSPSLSIYIRPSLNNSIRNSYFTQIVNHLDANIWIKMDGFKKLGDSHPWPRIKICNKRNFWGTCQKDGQGRIKEGVYRCVQVSTGKLRCVMCRTLPGASCRNSKYSWAIAWIRYILKWKQITCTFTYLARHHT